LSEWRDGNLGAVIMGLRHGLFCMGCCAGLMLLLFAVAVMDLRWVAALAALVTAEKLLPRPGFWRIAIGVGLLAASCITWFWWKHSPIEQAERAPQAPLRRCCFKADPRAR
jgi:predicted metal-binding membrane protein